MGFGVAASFSGATLPYKLTEGVTCINSASEYARVNQTYGSIDHFFLGHERY